MAVSSDLTLDDSMDGFLKSPEKINESASTTLTLDLMKYFMNTHRNASFVVSPYSVQLSMGMLLLGAETSTKTEVHGSIFSSSNYAPEFIETLFKIGREIESLRTMTKLIATHRAEFYAEYKKKLHSISKETNIWGWAEVNFEEWDLNRVAEWIDEIVDKKMGGVEATVGAMKAEQFLDRAIRLLAVQAFRYTTKWLIPFPTNPISIVITDGQFHKFGDSSSSATPITVEYMQQESTFRVYEDKKYRVLRKQTSTKGVAMYFVLPNERREMNASDFEIAFSAELIRMFRACVLKKAKLVLPKFRLDASWHDFSDVLFSLGLTKSFSHSKANYYKMARVYDLEHGFGISKFIQKYSFECNEGVDKNSKSVDENGESDNESTTEKPMIFVADHPFLFFLVHESDKTFTVLLFGRYSGPNEISTANGDK